MEKRKGSTYKRAQLRPLKQTHLKRDEYIGFDIETYGENNNFYMGGFYDKEGYKVFYDPDEMINYLHTHYWGSKTKIVATNLGFDFNGLFFGSRWWNEFKLVQRGSDLISASRKNRKNMTQTFIDTMNFAPFGVAVMGSILGIPKLPTPKVIVNDNLGYARKPRNKEEKEELEIYNKRDCEITYKFMNFLQEGFHSLGAKTKLTIASTSMDLFRRRYLRHICYKEDYVLKRDKDHTIHNFIFKAYYGGRTEAFSRGLFEEKKGMFAWDINSLYPSVMVNKYPKPDSAKLELHPTLNHIKEFDGFSHVKVYCPYMEYPLLPLRHDNKLIFPTGIFEGHYSHVELRKALELGYKIIKIYKTLYYTDYWYPFKHYVRELYNKRLEYKKEKSPMEIVTKLLLNSLFGKFSQRKMTDSQIVDYLSLDKEQTLAFKQRSEEAYTREGRFFLFNTPKECYKPFVIPMLSAHTTSLARLKLYDYFKYKPLYCDTDSIFTTTKLPQSDKLGDMKLEYDIKKAVLVKPKMYFLEYKQPDKFGNTHKVRLKGVSRLGLKGFYDILEGRDVDYMKFTKLKEGVRRGIKPNSIQMVTKSISLEDNKRLWGSKFDPLSFQKSKALKILEGKVL